MKNNIKELIIEIKPSHLLPGQIGLFAAREIKQGAIVAEASKLGEEFVTWNEFGSVDEITKSKIIQYCLQTNDGFYMPPNRDLNYLTVPWNMNHSCDYNVGFDDVGNFVAVRDIIGGEELVWDYGMGISYTKFRLTCECGSSGCRGIITGDDWKNKEFKEKNSKYFLRELLNS
jgi:hypothetical protein